MSSLIKQKQIESLVSDLQAKALDSAVVKKSNNLSDVTASSARTNLDVYSKSEVQSMVAGVDNAHSCADLTARNALTGLKVTDRVFVTNDGDSKWALYMVTAVTTGTGSTSTFVKIADEDLISNALTAAGIKSAYESNANTNVYTDAEKAKMAHIAVTQAVNLDTMESGLATTTTTASNALSTANTAVTNAATAQTTANTAVSNAATAQTAANNAQTAATNAQNTANGKEDSFTESREDFTTKTATANTPVPLTLAHSIAAGFVPRVFFNGLQIETVNFTPGQANMDVSVPYVTEVSDVISVFYTWR
jgi:hypothetical protein